jgi:Cu(I)/Ag(I) efflux system membrane fusion protein
VVIVADSGGFRPVEVAIGMESNGQTEIRKGLEAGQKIVVSGQFLVDSEASLRATMTRMGETSTAEAAKAGAEPTKAGGTTHRGQGKVESIAKDQVTLSHGPIPSLQWGAMTMGFKAPPGGVPKDVKVGDTVSFEIRQAKDGTFEIVSIAPAAGAAMKRGETMQETKK